MTITITWYISTTVWGQRSIVITLTQNYVQRKARRESADLASFSLALPQVSHEEKNYQSVQFTTCLHECALVHTHRPVKLEHTLGKLTPSSLATPRKAIDAPVGVGEVGGGAGVTVEVTTRKRQVLLIIERVMCCVNSLHATGLNFSRLALGVPQEWEKAFQERHTIPFSPPSSPPSLPPPPLPPSLQLYSHVLSLEDLERRALSLPEEERGVVLEQKECICTEIFALLRLRTLEKNSRSVR